VKIIHIVTNRRAARLYKNVASDWNLDLLSSLILTTDYNHMDQFLQQPAPTVH
jgi:hypothetical protein